ncbi:gamma-glutamylcyclotransferase family protein [Ascidiimonas sp. W6]|uniref:gamma-glutamylcyclotransferase family protein n=1 Tax=Ascidiimonas meishanensis TaxID=3128903 RepID=UPI0030ED6C84
MNHKKVVLAGFGTLLLQESLGDTVGKNEKKKFTPIIIKNYRRLFNLLPDHYEADNVLRTNGTEKGAANIEPAEGFSFNGLSFEADASDLASLDKRERYYKRSIVPYYDFETDEDLGMCHVYESPLNARWLVRNNTDLLPLWRDIVYARVGAYRISEAFGKMYDATTYMADGITLMIDYYKDHMQELEDLESVRIKYQK